MRNINPAPAVSAWYFLACRGLIHRIRTPGPAKVGLRRAFGSHFWFPAVIFCRNLTKNYHTQAWWQAHRGLVARICGAVVARLRVSWNTSSLGETQNPTPCRSSTVFINLLLCLQIFWQSRSLAGTESIRVSEIFPRIKTTLIIVAFHVYFARHINVGSAFWGELKNQYRQRISGSCRMLFSPKLSIMENYELLRFIAKGGNRLGHRKASWFHENKMLHLAFHPPFNIGLLGLSLIGLRLKMWGCCLWWQNDRLFCDFDVHSNSKISSTYCATLLLFLRDEVH